MSIRRRDFLVAATVTTVGAARSYAGPVGQPTTSAGPSPRRALLRLSSQERVMAGNTLAAKLDNMETWGFEGLEVGGRGLPARVKQYKQALKGRSIRITAVCAGFDGCIISEQRELRELAMRTMKEILTAAGQLQSTGLIIVPAFNNQTKLGHKESRELLIPLLQELGEHAVNVGSRVLLEPLNRGECYFLRLLADAAAICRDVGSPGVAMMGDFWHMTREETSDLGAFISAGDYLQHVHIASRQKRKVPGEDKGDNYVLGFKGLKWIGYQNHVSLECGVAGDRNVVIPAAARLLREQWEQA